MTPPTIALVGDYSSDVTAHRAIPVALELARASVGADIAWQWVHTREIGHAARDFAPYSAMWVVPASPYENMAGVLAAIQFAREAKRPFLGTCGGFQHAVIEFARNVAGIACADNAETNPSGTALVVTPLTCSLVEKSGEVRFAGGSRLGEIYGGGMSREGYHCSYGVNPAHRAALEHAGLVFTAFDSPMKSAAPNCRSPCIHFISVRCSSPSARRYGAKYRPSCAPSSWRWRVATANPHRGTRREV
jgi:CTP synthase (UTP-ammonia lyase)